MTEKIRQGGLKSSAQQLKKLIKMDGTLQGAFVLIPNNGSPYFFLSAAPTRTGAAGKVLPNLKGVADQKGLICGTARYSDGSLFVEIGRLPGATPQVKSPKALQKSLRSIARGGLAPLKKATITFGRSDDIEDSPSDGEDTESVAGEALSEDVLSELEAVDLSEEDQAEIAAFLALSSEVITRMDAMELPDSPSPLDGFSLADFSKKVSDELRANLITETRAVFADRNALRQKIRQVVSADYSAASVWDAWTLAHKLLRENVQNVKARKLYLGELIEILDRVECSYRVEAVPVTGMGLADYGFPLNHGLIRLNGMGEYMTIERGSPTSSDETRTNVAEHSCSYVKLANLFGAAMQAGAGSLVTTFQFKHHTKPKKFYLYRGYEQDCWSYIIDVCKMAGLTPPPPGHVTDEAEAKRWQSDSLAGKIMTKLGLIGTPEG